MHEPIAVVLAAGKGTRMNSDGPKVLCRALGRPLIDWVLDALEAAGVTRTVVVVGHQAERVEAALEGREGVEFVLQAEQLGTGHAVAVCRETLAGHDGPVIVVTGDSPLLQPDSLRALLDEFAKRRAACVLGSVHKDDPTGLGRIVRDASGDFEGIVEERDATPSQRDVTEVNMSTYVFDCAPLLETLGEMKKNNAQGEYYITDSPGILKSHGRTVAALPVLKECEALSVNTLEDLEAVEAAMRQLGYGR